MKISSRYQTNLVIGIPLWVAIIYMELIKVVEQVLGF